MNIQDMVTKAVMETRVTDIHTHIYMPGFGDMLLWGLDDMLTYHYLIAEAFRWLDIPYEKFWALSKTEQADLVWNALFVDHSPISESSRGLLNVLNALGLDAASRDLASYRRFFAEKRLEEHVDQVLDIARIDSVIMTNDPFDDLERSFWLNSKTEHPRFQAALRLDNLLNNWGAASKSLREWGYEIDAEFGGNTYSEVKRFLSDWIARLNAIYMAVSLPPTFTYPEESPRGKLIQKCVLPMAAETGKPLALMIGVKRLVNPGMQMAGDSVGKSNIEALERLCSSCQDVKFLVTMLSRENQHELCVTARKFRNIHVFGCWWYTNIPSMIDEITRMRLELLGCSFTAQHSDARVLEQLIYKWSHSRKIISDVLVEKYTDLAATGWHVTQEEINRDITDLFGGSFRRFIS